VPTNVKVIHARDFIRATPQGEAWFEKALELLQSIAEAGAGLTDFEVLVDTRRVTGGGLSAADLFRLAEALVRYRKTFARKTAVLCPLEKFDKLQFFALCAEDRGFNLRAFTSYEDAMEWLIADPPSNEAA
jgi:DNA-binding transcriptional LysR family regulator